MSCPDVEDVSDPCALGADPLLQPPILIPHLFTNVTNHIGSWKKKTGSSRGVEITFCEKIGKEENEMRKSRRYQHTTGGETRELARARILKLLKRKFPCRALGYNYEKNLLFLDGQPIKILSVARTRSRPENNILFYRVSDGKEIMTHIQNDQIYILMWVPTVNCPKKYPEMIFIIRGEDLKSIIPSCPSLGVYPWNLDGFQNKWEVLDGKNSTGF